MTIHQAVHAWDGKQIVQCSHISAINAGEALFWYPNGDRSDQYEMHDYLGEKIIALSITGSELTIRNFMSALETDRDPLEFYRQALYHGWIPPSEEISGIILTTNTVVGFEVKRSGVSSAIHTVDEKVAAGHLADTIGLFMYRHPASLAVLPNVYESVEDQATMSAGLDYRVTALSTQRDITTGHLRLGDRSCVLYSPATAFDALRWADAPRPAEAHPA